jgi:hypothetical protein
MRSIIAGTALAAALVLGLVVGPAPVASQPTPPKSQPTPSKSQKLQPKLEAVAETKLLMEALANTNFRGLERLLSQQPADQDNWVFARGQALLIGESANLLMMRPPRNEGQPVWFERATELRSAATQLAHAVAKKDYSAARAGLQTVAGACNRCHQTFRVPVQIRPFEATPQKAVRQP